MNDDLTIVIPAYGTRGGLLERAILSARANSVVVVDDATPDDSVRTLASRLGVGYTRRSTNGGVAAAQNTGVRLVTTPWVQFIHSDDRLPQSALTVRRGDGLDVIHGPSSTVQHVGSVSMLTERDLLRHRVGVHISNSQFRTAVVRELEFDPELRAWEDWDLLYRLAQRGPSVETVECSLSWLSGDAADRLVDSPAMVDGLLYLFIKHGETLDADRRARSIWEFKIARALVRQGARRRATHWMARSLRSEPFHPRRVVAFTKLQLGTLG